MSARCHFIEAFVVAISIGCVAQAETYICTIKIDKQDKGWISKTVGISINKKTNVVWVSDEILLQTVKRPVRAQLNSVNDNHLSVSWRIRKGRYTGVGDIPGFTYRAKVFKRRGTIRIIASPDGNYTSLSARGTCKVQK